MEKKLPYLFKWYKVNLTALAAPLSKQVSFIFSFCLLFAVSGFGQTTVFSDDFNRGAVVTPLSNGGAPSTTYVTKSLTGASVNATTQGASTTNLTTGTDYNLQLTPGTSFSARTYVTGKLSSFATPFNPILNSNSGLINWSFNMRTNRGTALTADAFAAGSYSGAVILCTDKEDYLDAAAKGYIVYMSRGAGTANQLILARFSGGLTAISNVTTIASSSALSALTNYASVKVTFNPSDGRWSLFVRDDGTTVFIDPSNVTTQAGTSVVDQTHTGSTMTDFGFFWNHGSTATPTSNVFRFDNFTVTINNPTISTSSSTLTGFNYGLGSGPSGEQTFTVGGQFLSANLTLTPPTNYEISTGTGGSFVATNPITLTPTSGTVASTTIYVRLKTGLSGANYDSENITIASTGATSKTVVCSGSVTTSPTITLSAASLTAFANTAAGASSTSSSFTASGSNLTGNITLTAPTNFQVSLDNSTFSSSVSLTQSSGTVSSTLVYARYSPSGSGGYSGTITATSTGASNQTVAVSGYLSTFYYRTGSLATTSSWSGTFDGTGTSVPLDFSTAGVSYVVLASRTTTTPWTVAGTGSKIIVGDPSVAGVTLTIASGAAITTTSPVVLDITAASSGVNNIVLQDVATPSFGTMAASSEVHYQATLSTGTSRTFGKLFVDGSGTTTTFTGTPVIQTSLFVTSGATMATGNLSGNYLIINSGASATINGTFQTQKSAGLVSSSVTPSSTFGTIQFIGTENLTLGATSTLVFNRASSGTAQTIDARTDYKNLTISGLDNNKTFASGALGIGGALTIGLTVTATTGTSNLTAVNPFNLTQNSIITLSTIVGAAVQSYTFADNSATAWTAGKTLTINGWTGTSGGTGTTGRVFFGNSATGLTAQQLSQIVFNISSINYSATQLSTGEVVPTLTILPISLISFTGKKENNGVQLKWSTATESNNQRFDILRAGADKNFFKIGEVDGNGNTSSASNYSYNDKNPIIGVNYYKLKQIDFDGKTQEFGPVAVTANLNAEALHVSSLSSQTEILVFFNSNTSKEIEINIYDLAGRNLISQKTNADGGFNTFKLASLALNKGIHILKITSKEGTLVKKFTY